MSLNGTGGVYDVTGGSFPTAIWAEFTAAALANEPVEYFTAPGSDTPTVPTAPDPSITQEPTSTPSVTRTPTPSPTQSETTPTPAQSPTQAPSGPASPRNDQQPAVPPQNPQQQQFRRKVRPRPVP